MSLHRFRLAGFCALVLAGHAFAGAARAADFIAEHPQGPERRHRRDPPGANVAGFRLVFSIEGRVISIAIRPAVEAAAVDLPPADARRAPAIKHFFHACVL